MRARSVVAIPVAALIGLAVAPAQARHSDAAASHFGRATPRPFTTGRIADSLSTNGDQILVFDRSSGRVVAFDRRAVVGSRRSTLLGFPGEFGGFAGFIDGPAALGLPEPIQEAEQPLRSPLAADLPPCHEMTPAGVVIERGMACSRISR
jgi:hypothetical protein